MQCDFSEIAKLGLDDPPQCGHSRFDVVVAVVVGVPAFLGTANSQISVVMLFGSFLVHYESGVAGIHPRSLRYVELVVRELVVFQGRMLIPN